MVGLTFSLFYGTLTQCSCHISMGQHIQLSHTRIFYSFVAIARYGLFNRVPLFA